MTLLIHSRWGFKIIAACLCWSSFWCEVCAEDRAKPSTITFTTKDGTEYKDVRLSRVLPTGITIFTETGVTTLPSIALPDGLIESLTATKGLSNDAALPKAEFSIGETLDKSTGETIWSFDEDLYLNDEFKINLYLRYQDGKTFHNPVVIIVLLEIRGSYKKEVTFTKANFRVDGLDLPLANQVYTKSDSPLAVHYIKTSIEKLRQIAMGQEVLVKLDGSSELEFDRTTRNAFKASLERWLRKGGGQ